MGFFLSPSIEQLASKVKPKDFLEEMWVRDVVDLTWDSLRMRRVKTSLLTSALGEGLDELGIMGWKGAGKLSNQWAKRNRQSVKQLDKKLTSEGLSIEAPIAHVLASRIDQFERIDRMIMNAEARRNAALREIDRHRASLSLALRQASDDVIEAEFEDVPPQPRAQ